MDKNLRDLDGSLNKNPELLKKLVEEAHDGLEN